jgi:rSAM/selenodomain-associated transferase 1
MPELSTREAAELSALLIRETARIAAVAWPGPILMLCWPDHDHPVFTEVARDTRILIGTQIQGDLGDKMRHALDDSTSRGIPGAVMGCDVPHCPPEQIRRAYGQLRAGRDVIGPCVDGGYYLIGLQQRRPELFSGINWGGADVLSATLAAAAGLGVDFTLLAPVRDIDDYEDLVAASFRLPKLAAWLK